MLHSEYKKRIYNVQRKYEEGKERDKMIVGIKEWRIKCQKRIKKQYGYVPTSLPSKAGEMPKREEKGKPLTIEYMKKLHEELIGAEMR